MDCDKKIRGEILFDRQKDFFLRHFESEFSVAKIHCYVLIKMSNCYNLTFILALLVTSQLGEYFRWIMMFFNIKNVNIQSV